MAGMKRRILKKLQSIPQIVYKKQRVLHLKASDAFIDTPPPPPSNQSPNHNLNLLDPPKTHQPEIIDVAELMRGLEEKAEPGNKENITPPPSPLSKNQKPNTNSPDPDSGNLFDPALLAIFEQAVMDHIRNYEKEEQESRTNTYRGEDPLIGFDGRRLLGGSRSVILYTTSLRGVRKTFEDCGRVRKLLQSTKVLFQERDVSMHLKFREELWGVLGFRAIPPRLFVDGKDIGGADEVLGMHGEGRLLSILEGMPLDGRSGEDPCDGCGGTAFVVCFECGGSRKIYDNSDDKRGVLSVARCYHCNENGLILCPIC